MKIYYKVVNPDMSSVLSKHLPLNFVVRYKVNKWIYPNIPRTKLIVFNNFEKAMEFASPYDYIYSCVVKNPSYKGLFVSYIHLYSDKEDFLYRWRQLRKKQLQHKKFFNPNEPPEETIFVSAVKLLERVHP